jgi:hypothetical protein
MDSVRGRVRLVLMPMKTKPKAISNHFMNGRDVHVVVPVRRTLKTVMPSGYSKYRLLRKIAHSQRTSSQNTPFNSPFSAKTVISVDRFESSDHYSTVIELK